jgi:hypothetical protein
MPNDKRPVNEASATMNKKAKSKVPVTVLTGFLGAGTFINWPVLLLLYEMHLINLLSLIPKYILRCSLSLSFIFPFFLFRQDHAHEPHSQ